jgi:predicted RNase H-like HicB family nuclease
MTQHDSALNDAHTKPAYTAIIQQDGTWWIGWIKEIPGVNCQEATREELLESLRETLNEALEFNSAEAVSAARGDYTEVPISP